MDVEQLSDADLREGLLENGFNAGPVTPSTRRVYERKLGKLLSERSVQSSTEFVTTTETYEQQVIEEDFQTEDVVDDLETVPEPVESQEPVDDSEPKPLLDCSTPTHYPRSYELPQESTLLRRPLRRDFVDSAKKTTYTKTTVTSSSSGGKIETEATSKGGRCKIFLIVLLILIALGVLVYMYMEPLNLKKLEMKKK